MKEDTFINILLLGETGVGKSTFINSFVNYLTYNDFNKAKNGNLTTLIPSKCQVQDKHGEYHTIEIGSEYDTNECLETGMSATQDVKSYVFSIWKDAEIKIRLIDTPGIGDVRGIEQDNINCENIVRFIRHFKELHAICYLLKPTHSRITIYFDYCLTQILSRLEKSVSENIIFIFTNSRGTDYTPGDTLVNLEKIIDDIKSHSNVNIPLDQNVFCFDNEPFRCLAAIKENVQFDRSVRQRNYESWKQSSKQCRDLINYIVGNEEHPPLLPHFVETTYNINEGKRFIVLLSQPLAEISQLINDNLLAIQRHEENIELESDMLNKLKQNLYSSITDLQIIKLGRNNIVCASRKCTEKYVVGGVHKIHYTQICQDFCYNNIPKDIIGCPELLLCSAIDSSSQACKMCQCDFSAHICIDYKTVPVKSILADNTVTESINSKEKVLQSMKQEKMNIDMKNGELEKERDTILKTCTRFAHFLKNNVILPFSKSYKGYIEYLIMQKKSLGASSDKSAVECLHKLLQEYEAAKQSFDKALSFNKIYETDVLMTPYLIEDGLKELYLLKHSGAKIKALYNCFEKSHGIKYNYTEYVHETLLFVNQKCYPNERIYKSTNNYRAEISHKPQNQYRSNEQSENQCHETYHLQNNQSNRYHRGRGRFQNRSRGRGQWQHRSRGRNRSQTDDRSQKHSRTRDSENEQSQSSDSDEIQSYSKLRSSESSENDKTEGSQSREYNQQYRQFRSEGGERDQWKEWQDVINDSVSRSSSRSPYSERDHSQTPHRYNKREQSQSPNREYNQSYHQARSENKGRGQWRGQGRGRGQSQTWFKERDQQEGSNISSASSRSGNSESDQTESSEQKDQERNLAPYRGRGRGRNQRQYQGRTRGQWQNRGRGNSQMQKRDQSQSSTREGNQTHNQSRFQNRENRGRGQWRGQDRGRNQSQFRSRNESRNQSSENNNTPHSSAVKENPQTTESDLLTQFSLGAFSRIPDTRKTTTQSQNQNNETSRPHSSLSHGKFSETIITGRDQNPGRDQPPWIRRQNNENNPSSITGQSQTLTQQRQIHPSTPFAGPHTVASNSTSSMSSSTGMNQSSNRKPTIYPRTSFGGTQSVARHSPSSATSSTGMNQSPSQRPTVYTSTSFGGTPNRTTISNSGMFRSPSQHLYRKSPKPVKKKEDCTLL